MLAVRGKIQSKLLTVLLALSLRQNFATESWMLLDSESGADTTGKF